MLAIFKNVFYFAWYEKFWKKVERFGRSKKGVDGGKISFKKFIITKSWQFAIVEVLKGSGLNKNLATLTKKYVCCNLERRKMKNNIVTILF
jgi:hypothetical protein